MYIHYRNIWQYNPFISNEKKKIGMGLSQGRFVAGVGLSVYHLEHFSIHFWWLWKRRKNYGKLEFKPSFKQLKRVGGGVLTRLLPIPLMCAIVNKLVCFENTVARKYYCLCPIPISCHTNSLRHRVPAVLDLSACRFLNELKLKCH